MQQEQLNAVLGSLADAIRTAVTEAVQSASSRPASSVALEDSGQNASRPPRFSMGEFKSADGSSVRDYFARFDWALQLSKIASEEYHNYARVHMGAELNTALKILISPKQPEVLSYDEIKSTLSNHFDGRRNVYAESFKFRQVRQNEGEPLAAFALRLKQASTFCEYGAFLDRMLVEQMIFGLESRLICDEVIARKPKDFAEAYEIASSKELTQLSTSVFSAAESSPTEPTCKLGFIPVKTKNDVKQRTNSATEGKCHGCGGRHMRKDCKFKNLKCFACGKLGHISKVCRSNTRQVSDSAEDENCEPVQSLQQIAVVKTGKAVDRKMIVMVVDGKSVDMELDTGAPCSIMSVKNLRSLKKSFVLQKSNRQFSSYTGHRINCIGRIVVNAKYGRINRRLNLYVVDGEFDTLCGREWIAHFAREINFVELFNTEPSASSEFFPAAKGNVNAVVTQEPTLSSNQQLCLKQLLSKYDDVFGTVAGKFKGPPVKVHLKADAKPIFARPREIPFALRDAYAKEIDAKIAAGFYKRVEYSEWASTTHVVTKKSGAIRITGNYKPTINPQMVVDEHPIPRAEDIFNRMKGATVFANLDITDAYSHLEVDENFAHVLTLNTATHGLIRPTRAVYGAANVPAIWQRTMEMAIQGIPNILNFFDDILIYAKNVDELLKILEMTLERLRNLGFKLNRGKCVFVASSIEFLGHRIDDQGIHKSNKHIEAILHAPTPTTLEDLQLFLGKATYYSNFIPNLSTLERPLRDIAKEGRFSWSKDADIAFQKIKKILISPQVLMPYDPALPLLLATDASKTGLGAVLSHRLPNNQERPIAYASRTMSATEQRYSTIDKEALAIVWAVQKFFKYLYARHWTLITDHKPLVQIMQPSKSLPVLCISRMANYSDFLSNFDFNVVHKTSKENANADYLSRIMPKVTKTCKINSHDGSGDDRDGFDNFIIGQINQLPLTAESIARETKKDEHLGKILQILESGGCVARAGYKSPEINYKLSSGCLTFEHRIVIPPKWRNDVLGELHRAHLGVVKMKGIARSFVYWPGIDKDIEGIAKNCELCAKYSNVPTKFKDHHWEYPKAPWERVHIDYAGPFEGMMLLIITDAFSKWLEVKVTKSITAASTIALMDDVFATFGVPLMIVSDNGSNFTSAEFNNFLTRVGVKYHKYTAPYHPSTNGQAERNVQTIKNALKAMCTTRDTLRENINEFLRQYRNAPHYSTGQSPAQLLFGRQLRTRIDLMRPEETGTKISSKQFMKTYSTYRELMVNQTVYFLSGNPRISKWLKGKVNKRLGDIHYEIVFQGKYYRRHIDQIRGLDGTGSDTSIVTQGTVRNRYETNLKLPASSGNGFRQTPSPDRNNGNRDNSSSGTRNEMDTTVMDNSDVADFFATPTNTTQRNENESTPTSSSPFEGFPDRPTPPAMTGTQAQNPDLRRSTRVRRQRVLFSP